MSTQTVTITPKYVNPPKPGKKFGTLKTAEGASYAAGAHVTSQCVAGAPVTIEWEPQTWGQDSVMVANRVVAAPQPANNPPPPSPDAYGAQPPSAPTPSYNGNGGNSGRDIFVTGVVGRALGSGSFSVTDIKGLTLAADEAWLALQEKRAGRNPFQ